MCACSKAAEAKLVAAVAERDTLKLGVDVVEQDAWGMDAYTRKNVFDGECAHGHGHARISSAVAVCMHALAHDTSNTPR